MQGVLAIKKGVDLYLVKRKELFFSLLQETHSGSEFHNLQQEEWGGPAI